jgi:methyl-CpG-binding domain protein 4
MLHRKIVRPLLQEIYQQDGWKMLTCCMLLNLTNRKQVDTIRDELFKRYPTPNKMMDANQSELAELLKPLGLYNRRAKSLKKMSEGYVKGFKSVDELYGIGQYAKDSWDIFQNNDVGVIPTDKVLLAYLSIENKQGYKNVA